MTVCMEQRKTWNVLPIRTAYTHRHSHGIMALIDDAHMPRQWTRSHDDIVQLHSQYCNTENSTPNMPERLSEWVGEEEAKERPKYVDRKTVDVINFIILKHETKVRVRLCHHRTIYRIICCYTKRIVHFYLWPECDWVYFGSLSLSRLVYNVYQKPATWHCVPLNLYIYKIWKRIV